MHPNLIIWHNPECSTSKKTLELLQQHFKQVTIREYLIDIPSVAELKELLDTMEQTPGYILRKKKEPLYEELSAAKELTNEEWIAAMHQYPVLIERPIIFIDDKRYLARPYETFEAMIERKYPVLGTSQE